MTPRALKRPLIGAVLLAMGLATAPALTAPALAAAATASVSSAPVLQPALLDHLAEVSSSTPVRVMIQAGGSLSAAKQAASLTGLTPELTLDRIGIAVATGTPDQIRDLATAQGVTRVDWADEPMEYFSDTSHLATRAQYLQDGALDLDGDGTLDKFTGKGFSVAIVDSGTDGTHPMFADENGDSRVKKNIKMVCSDSAAFLGTIFLGDDSWHTAADCSVDATAVNDTDTPSLGGHGTHVTGIAAGGIVTDAAGRHLRGAAPDADIVAISTGATLSVLSGTAGMYWVLDHHADPCGDGSCGPIVAVNNSWGSSGATYSPSAPQDVVARALVNEGVVVNFAAGNDGGDGKAVATNPYGLDPLPGIISVANYDDANTGTRDNDLDSSSSRGKIGLVASYPDISAPGANITSACRPYLPVCSTGLDFADPNYNTISGTSMATPHITGYVAVLQQIATQKLGRLLTPAEIENLLVDTAYQFGNRTWEADTRNPSSTTGTTFDAGHGLVDMAAAVERLTGLPVMIVPPGCSPTAEYADAQGDATGALGFDVAGGPNAAGLDITKFWLTADADTSDVTFHWKVADLADQPGGLEGEGEYFDFNFTFAGADYYMGASRTIEGGESFLLGNFGGTTGGRATLASGLPGSFDPDTDEIQVTLPAATWASLNLGSALSPGGEISGLSLVGRRELVVLVPDADTATGKCTYSIGAEHVIPEEPNTPPNAQALASSSSAVTGEEVVLDGSGSSDSETPNDLTYAWDFGDGGETVDATTPTATVSYAQAGDYTVTLTVSDVRGATDTDSLVIHVADPVNAAPTAQANVDQAEGTTLTEFAFDAVGSADAETPNDLTYAWDFGDGSDVAAGDAVTHTFATEGTFVVTLTVADPEGATGTDTVEVLVTQAPNQAPTAVAVATPSTVDAGEQVTLDATGSTDPEGGELTYAWDFGNGGSKVDSTEPTATVAYPNAGSKTVTLTVTDAEGLVDTTTVEVTVLKAHGCGNNGVQRTGWTDARSADAAAGNYCRTTTVQQGVQTMRFTSTGDALRVAYGRSRLGGAAKVIVDGQVLGKLSFRSSTSQVRFGRTLTFEGLGAGTHRVVIKMLNADRIGYIDYLSY